jgi:uncharacterized protein YaaQ
MAELSIHLLLIVIIQEEDLDIATHTLQQNGIPVTYLSSAGGFLGRRNVTLLIGLSESKEQTALDVLHKVCRQRVEYMTLPIEGSSMPMPAPIPVTVGGATAFALPVERFEQF